MLSSDSNIEAGNRLLQLHMIRKCIRYSKGHIMHRKLKQNMFEMKITCKKPDFGRLKPLIFPFVYPSPDSRISSKQCIKQQS